MKYLRDYTKSMGGESERVVELNTIYNEDCRETIRLMDNESVDMCITSPPYWGLRDYGHPGQLGQEKTFQEYLEKLFDIFQLLYPKIKGCGSVWINLGDTYSGSKTGNSDLKNYKITQRTTFTKTQQDNIRRKSLIGIPDRFKVMMIDAGWICRNEIIWHKRNPMPSSAKDRFTIDYEKLFFFTKNDKYYFNQQLEPYKSSKHNINKPRNRVSERYATNALGKNKPLCSPGERDWYNRGGRNKRCVWSLATKPNLMEHYATYPQELIRTPIKASCPPGGVVYDPFMGSGTTAVECIDQEKNFMGSELNNQYWKDANERTEKAKRKKENELSQERFDFKYKETGFVGDGAV